MPYLEHNGVALYYEREGWGPPVLFIQGVGVTGEGWRPQVAGLAGAFETLIFDNRGIGRSSAGSSPVTIEQMAADARALMDAAGWTSAHIVGHSMGGVIAQQLALDVPTRVRSLSLLCTFASGRAGARPTPRVIWLGLRTRVGTRRMRRHAFLEMLFPREFLRAIDRDQLAARIAVLVGRDLAVQPPVLMDQLRALGRHDASSRLGELAGLPTLVLSATHDPIARPVFGRALARLIPGARYEECRDASHALPIQQAQRINAELRQFFDAVSSARD